MSPLHSGQEDKRGRKGWDRYSEEKKTKEEEGFEKEGRERRRKWTVLYSMIKTRQRLWLRD